MRKDAFLPTPSSFLLTPLLLNFLLIPGALPLYRSFVRSPPGEGKETAATQANKITAKFQSTKRVPNEDAKIFLPPERKFRDFRETGPWGLLVGIYMPTVHMGGIFGRCIMGRPCWLKHQNST